MKTNRLHRLVLLMLLLVSSACSKQESSDNQGIPMPKIQLVTTRSTTSADGKVTWNAQDRIKVFIRPAGLSEETGWSAYEHEYTTDEKDCQKGIFSPKDNGTLTPGIPYDWYVMSPFSDQVTDPIGGSGSTTHFSLDGQTEDTNHPLDHVSQFDILTATAEGVLSEQQPSFVLRHKTALLKFTLTNGEVSPMTLKSMELIAPQGVNIGGSYSIDFSPEGLLTPINPSSHVTLRFKNSPILESGQSIDAYVCVPPFHLNAGSTFTVRTQTSEGILENKSVIAQSLDFFPGKLRSSSIRLISEQPEIQDPEPGKTQAVAFDFSGQRCIYCPNMTRSLIEMKKNYGENYIIVVLHSDQGFSPDLYQKEAEAYHKNMIKEGTLHEGFPNNIFNSLGSYKEQSAIDRQYFERPSRLSLKTDLQVKDRTLSVRFNARICKGQEDRLQGTNLCVLMWLTENDVVKPQSDTHVTGGWDMQHHHQYLFRKSLNGQWGSPYTIGSTYKFEAVIPEGIVISNSNLIILVLDQKTKEVIGASEMKI